MFSVLPHRTAYNGTNLTITGSIEVDSNVNTPITVSGMWPRTGESGPQVTTASPYLIMLSLLPVATDSSGEYIVMYTIRSSDNSSYIVQYSGRDSYNLTVASKPFWYIQGMCYAHFVVSIYLQVFPPNLLFPLHLVMNWMDVERS